MIERVGFKEKGFEIHFLTACDGEADWRLAVHDAVGGDGVVLQERIIAPSSQIENAGRSSVSTRPLIILGNEKLPVRFSAIVLKTRTDEAIIDKLPHGAKLSTPGFNLFFSDPIFSPPDSSETSFYVTFEKISAILAEAGMRESELVRTWLYAKSILNDYKILNSARTKYFRRWLSCRNTFIPASTGIQGITKQRAPLSIDFCAFSGKDIQISQVPSPMQSEATEYDKCFSRGVQVTSPANRLLFISGTASINEKGESVHLGDFSDQMNLSLEVIEAILRVQDTDFADIAQAIVYLKRHEDLEQCKKILDARGFPLHHALIQTDTDVCRPELLCEIETIALRRRRGMS